MSQFKIDYSRLTMLLLPSFLRSSRILLLVRAAVQGVSSLYGIFTVNRNANIYRLSNNSQVCYLEKVLNDAYDKTNRKIHIDDYSAYGTLSYIYSEYIYDTQGNIIDSDTVYAHSHMILYAKPTSSSTAADITGYANSPILCSEKALATGQTTFKVMIANTSSDIEPVYSAVGTQTQDLDKNYRKFCSLINTYKLAGKKYTIAKYTPS